MHNKETRVDHAGFLQGNVVEHVGCLLETCSSVDVRAKFGADATQIVEDSLAGEVFGAVEAHVFEEMGKTVLVVFFLESADVSSEIEFASLCRLVVVTDEVGHAVLQLTDFDSRVGGQRLELLSKSRQYENKSDCR